MYSRLRESLPTAALDEPRCSTNQDNQDVLQAWRTQVNRRLDEPESMA